MNDEDLERWESEGGRISDDDQEADKGGEPRPGGQPGAGDGKR